MDKYKQFILDIIINRGRFAIPDTEYTEVHHIIPECMGGTSEKENLVQLYAKEHLLAHKLLKDIYPSHDGVDYAFWQMCNRCDYCGIVTLEEYEEAKNRLSKRMKGENNPAKRPEVRKKIGEKNSKPVEAIDPESGQRVLYFKSSMDAERSGFDHSAVAKCCNGKPWYKTHKGYIWRYVKEVSDNDSNN